MVGRRGRILREGSYPQRVMTAGYPGLRPGPGLAGAFHLPNLLPCLTYDATLRYGLRMNSTDDSKKIELVDEAGQSILDLLHKAADTVDQETRQTVESAQRLAQQLQAARARIAQLDSELANYRDHAERSESWLDKVRTEIEQQFPTSGRKPQR
jgi:hypothetical protein